ncbi:MAG TPA: right-handed parallel beta-helix repeat-containing protein [Longimicrobium sp.]|nr:right-handed parallel beta-helix repeat-containing protein [Longimicrobium sp.]
MRIHTRATSLLLLALLAACADQPVTPAAREAGRSLAAAKACAESPAFVVHTDPELRVALAAAGSGDVIAISGNVALDSIVTVTTEGVTLTCAEPGAGLSLAPGNEFGLLLDLWVGHVTISGLVLDAEYGYAAVTAVTVDEAGLPHIRLTANEIDCGYTFCIFVVGVPYLEVTDNHFKGDETRFGVQIQGSPIPQPGGGYPLMPGIVVSRNVIENEEGYLGQYGGIRLRDGRDATITHNQILGSWSGGVTLTNVYDSRVEHNRIDGVLRDGIDFLLVSARRISASGVSVKANQITNVGRAGISVRGACWNTFEGNNVGDNPVGARFEPSTGDNVYRGVHEIVQDGGAFDCDLDGDIDPNRISGVQSRPLPDTVPGPAQSLGAVPVTRGGRSFPAAQ